MEYFDQHLVNGVKYGRCKDETCPGKSQKNRQKTECDVDGEILIRCTGSRMVECVSLHLSYFGKFSFQKGDPCEILIFIINLWQYRYQ